MFEKNNKENDIEADHQNEKFLNAYGYQQQLERGLNVWSALSIGFAAISPVVGTYAVISLGMVSIGPVWLWVLPICFVLQFLVALIYAELASGLPLAGGCYQWIKILVGKKFAWFAGFIYLASALTALSTVTYLGGFWLWLLLTGTAPTANQQVLGGGILLMISIIINFMGINLLKYLVNMGIIAEVIASLCIGLLLILFFRHHPFNMVFDSLGAIPEGGSFYSHFLTAMAVGGWAFLGFDACTQVSEETKQAHISIPRAIIYSMLLVGFTVMLTAVSVTLSYSSPERVISGEVIDPIVPVVTQAFGGWVERPFIAVIFIAFLACELSIHAAVSRGMYGMARDNILPMSKGLSMVSSRKVPMVALLTSSVLASCGLALGLNETAVGTLISFGSGGLYLVFLMVTASALWARCRTKTPINHLQFSLGRWGRVINVVVVIWLIFECINIAWPRTELAPPGAIWIQVWSVIIVFTVLSVIAALYLFLCKPYLRM